MYLLNIILTQEFVHSFLMEYVLCTISLVCLKHERINHFFLREENVQQGEDRRSTHGWLLQTINFCHQPVKCDIHALILWIHIRCIEYIVLNILLLYAVHVHTTIMTYTVFIINLLHLHANSSCSCLYPLRTWSQRAVGYMYTYIISQSSIILTTTMLEPGLSCFTKVVNCLPVWEYFTTIFSPRSCSSTLDTVGQ